MLRLRGGHGCTSFVAGVGVEVREGGAPRQGPGLRHVLHLHLPPPPAAPVLRVRVLPAACHRCCGAKRAYDAAKGPMG